MEYKKTIILLALVVFLLSIAGVSASEIDNTIASENANTIELSIDNDIEDNLQTSEENEALASTDYDEAIAQTDTEVLGEGSAKYSDLAEEIGHSGNITLIHKNYTYDGGEPITISEANKVIDGNGAVIDMNGSTIRAFHVTASGVTIKNLTIKNANYDGHGGAIRFSSAGTVSNCNFTNNTAYGNGGAVFFFSTGTVSNCNFVNNSATGVGRWGGAIRMYSGNVSNCNFINNKATGEYSYGGAVWIYSDSTVSNCNFTDNTASEDGGAVYFSNTGSVSNCNFTDNTAGDWGGAVYFNSNGEVTNCNFTGNNATTGSAIYFYKWVSSDTLTVSNSTFLNNRANAEALEITKNDNNITITFTGRNNLLNAIYSRNDAEVTFTNVTYWGATGITTVSAKLSGSNKAAGQNITVKGVVNGKIIDKINGTDENGEIVLDDAGDYWIIVSHKGDLYYTEIAETLFTNMKLYANVTSLTTNNKTVNITAKSNIFSEVMPGKLLFILPNGTEINATYGTNGTWWAVHKFADYDVYQVNAKYDGLDNVAVNKGTIAVTGPEHTFSFLNYKINGNDNSVIELSNDFYFDPDYDTAFVNGIVINRPVTIKGNGNAIDAKRQARIFNVQSSDTVIENLTLKNANYDGDGGAVYFVSTGTVTNCNFTGNNATRFGGAVYFNGKGDVTNCNFTNNTASLRGGAVFFFSTGNVSNCNFTDNIASIGGAVFFIDDGDVSNCNFVNNSAPNNGGAVFFNREGTVSNCNFINNKATGEVGYGGAIRMSSGSVENCNFTNNTAGEWGGAIRMSSGSVENCNFTGNNATAGSAIYFFSTSATKTVSNSRFLNNRANVEALEITKNDNNITITFTGRNNLLNAIYSSNDAEVTFTNVTYWGAKGITTVSSTMSGSNKAAGQNITVGVVVNNELVLSDVMVTNESGMIVLDISAGENYYIGVRHDTDSYYTEAEKTISNNINVNVTSQTTTNKTVNITAKSNIYSEVMPGKLLFILPNGTQIEATYGSNGTWWAVHEFDKYDVYQVTASYVGLDNVTVNKGTIAVTGPEHTFSFLNYKINGNDNPVIELSNDFYFDSDYDAAFVNGIVINRPIAIKGNGIVIDAKGQARIFDVRSEDTVIENLTFKNANYKYANGGAVYFVSSGTVSNCNFTGNTAGYGGAVYFYSTGNVSNCNFTGNTADYSGAVYFYSTGNVSNCNFTGNTADYGGAVYFLDQGTVSNCNFTDNSASGDGGAIRIYSGSVSNCNFTGNTAGDWGGAIRMYSGSVSNCNFTGNTADYSGGAVYFVNTGNVTNCNFVDNKATGNYGRGGAVYFDWTGTVSNCNFTDNSAYRGGAVFFNSNGNVTNCNFTGNNANWGSAIYFYKYFSSDNLTVSNSTFLNNRANSEALDVVKNDNNITITFTGRNNLLNAIYSRNDAEVTFTNVTYWGAKGITTVSARLSGSNKAAGQNITVGVVVNGEIVLNQVNVTNEDGTIVLNINAGENYYITARHDTDSYYTEAEKAISNNTKFNVNVTSQTTNNKTVNITAKSNIPQDVVQGKLLFILPNGTQINATYGTNGTWWAEHTFDAYGEYKVNATYVGLDNVTINNGTITINKVNSTITLENIVLDYGETKNVTVTTTGATGITAKIDGNNVTVINNYTIPISGLGAGNYTLTVTTIPDDDHNPVTKEVNITVNKVNSTLTVNDIVFDYGSSGSTVVSLAGAYGVNATVVGQPKTVVKVNGTNITVSDLDAGTYTLTVTTIADKNHNNITKNATITVNKVNSTLTLDDVVLDYGESKNITVTTEGATGITAKIDGNNVTVINNYTIQIPVLDAGTYNLTVTTIPDDDHNPVTKEVNITVNKVNSTLTVNDIVFDYGSSGSTVVSLAGAYGVNATVVGQPKTVVKVNGTNITVSDLDAGTYTLTVTTIADKNHNNITKNATITVNKVNGTLTVNDVVLDYGESKNITVTTEGATGITAKIDGVNVTVNDYIIPISGLSAGNYTLTVTTIADKNHNPVTKEANINVNKVESTLTVDDIVFDYDSEGSGDVSFTGASEVLANVVNQSSAVVSVSGNKIFVSGLGAGTYTLNVTTVPDENHTAVTKTAGITVNKINSTLTLDDVVLDYGESKNITVTTEGATGITAKIDGVNVTVNGYTIPISGLGAGNYTLSVTTIPDDNHNPVTKEANINVNKVKSTLTVGDIVFDYDSEGSGDVSFTGASEVTANVVNQSSAVVSVSGNKIFVSGLGAGTYTLNVTTVPDENHTAVTETAGITVNKINSTLTLDDVVLDYGESKNITVTTEGATGITAKIDGVNVTVNDYIIPISGLGAGNYTLSVTTIPDDNHNPVTKEANINVNKVKSTLTVGDIVFDYDGEGSGDVSFTGASEVTANVINQPKAVVSVSGNKISVSGLGAGSYTLNVTTVPDENHTAVTKTAGITVNKINSTLTLDDVVLDYGESKNITVTTEGATGITAKIDGVNVTVNGYTIPISGLGAGNYTLTVTTIADENHNPVTKEAKITVNKVESTLTVGDIVFDYGSEGSGDVSFTGASEVLANVVNQPSAVVSVSGNKISVSGLAAGTYTLNVTIVPDENHTAVTETAGITVNKINSTLTLDDVVLDYGESKNITVATEGATGIAAKIDGVNVTVNGYTIPISGLGAGNYTLSVTTIPDENHNPVTVTSKITVNKVESTLTVGDIVFDYDGEGSGDVSFTGASEVLANVINQPKAVVSVNDNKISVSGLAAGTYTLNVTTVPDENHTAVTETATITVNKVNSTLTLDDVVLDYGDSKNVTVTTEGATGITAKIDGVNVTVNGYTIPISGLGAGNYTLTVTTIADKNHNPVTKEANITVNKVNATLTVNDVVLDYGETKNITVTTEGATGITAKIDGVNVTVSNYTIPISGLSAGNYTLTVTTIADANHNNITKNATITVNKVNSTLTLDDVVLDYGETKNITVATEGATGIAAKIDGVNVTVNGYTIPISGLGAGNYTLTVTTISDKNHNPVTKEVNITVNKLSTEIILANETLDLKVGDEVTDLANLTPAGAGNLTLTSSDEDLVYIDDDGIVIGNGQGQAIITVSFAGNENYTAAENKTITVNVELNDASVSVENATLNLKVDETSAINATIEPDTIMLKIKYTSSDDSVVTVDKNGIVTAVGEGRAIITLEVGDDEIYAKNSTTVTVTVNKINTTADVSIPENITVGDNSTVNVVLPADAKGNVTVKVDGEVVDTVPVKDGNADVTIPSMSAGNHTVEIAYSGDGKYDPVNETKDITVSKNDITPEIRIPSEIEFGDNATVDVKLPGDATGNVTLTVDGKEINTVPVTNGTASVKLPALDAGNHTAEIAYSGDDKYKSASKTTTISIDKDSTKITAADVTATYNVNKYLVITLKDSKGNPLANASVTVDLNTIKNYTADENGQIKIKVSNLVPKTYDVKIAFAGDNNYLGSDATAKVVVKKATPKIIASNKMFKTTTKNKKYTITLKDNTGKPIRNAKVYLKVNGKTYKATTNSKGKATFKIVKLSKTGTFKATVTYKGNKYYNKVTKKVTVKVISAFKTISKGSKAKSTVKDIQRALKNHGYYLTAYGHYLKVDGIYWDYTVKAVKQFQKAKGLKVTGKVDEKTAKKLGLI